jgi:hypothetical protein
MTKPEPKITDRGLKNRVLEHVLYDIDMNASTYNGKSFVVFENKRGQIEIVESTGHHVILNAKKILGEYSATVKSGRKKETMIITVNVEGSMHEKPIDVKRPYYV